VQARAQCRALKECNLNASSANIFTRTLPFTYRNSPIAAKTTS
jgi:hypothetical protein